MDYLAILKKVDQEREREVSQGTEASEQVRHCDSATCGGCYSVGVLDGSERFLHPPKPSEDWQEWLRRWQPKGGPIQ